MRTANIFIMSHLLFVTDWKYFNSSLWAASTFNWASSTLESILKKYKKREQVSHS